MGNPDDIRINPVYRNDLIKLLAEPFFIVSHVDIRHHNVAWSLEAQTRVVGLLILNNRTVGLSLL